MPNCRVCGQIAGEEAWRTLCRRCYAANKRAELEELQGELAAAQRRIYELERRPRADAPTLKPDQIKRLIMLCHPDKHGNSKVSNEITQWMLGLRR